MITERDLQEAIAECEGQRNPNANTCIKLAAYLTIKSMLYPDHEEKPLYSYATGGHTITYSSGTEFSDAIYGKNPDDILAVMDELMSAVQVLQPKLYNSVMSKL